MTKISINDKEYDSEDLTKEQTDLVNLLNLGQNSLILFNHMVRCTQSVQQMKTEELKTSLEGRPTISDVTKKQADDIKKSLDADTNAK
tara:strand:- start:907 stop:1170 length:264 start_codon:yes stop_codon:yes gene_type:complete